MYMYIHTRVNIEIHVQDIHVYTYIIVILDEESQIHHIESMNSCIQEILVKAS